MAGFDMGHTGMRVKCKKYVEALCCRLVSLPSDRWNAALSPCRHANSVGLTSARASPALGFWSSCASAATLWLESKASESRGWREAVDVGLSSIQLHLPFVARLTMEVLLELNFEGPVCKL